MRRLDEPAEIDAALRHPALRDRAPLENALSRQFFAPFVHQEVVQGARFEARAAWSRAALGGMPPEVVALAADRAFERHARAGLFPSLLEEVRRVVASATALLALGDDAHFESLAIAAVADFDRGIKMIAAPDRALRGRLASALRARLADPGAWQGTSYLTVAREAALALPLGERVDHLAGVLLGTGAIQVSDVVTHALIALDQHPAARAHSSSALLRETLRLYPVNASLTRLVKSDVAIAGRRYRRGEAVTVVPLAVNRLAGRSFDAGRSEDTYAFAFGVGPRACPARRVALTLAEALLDRYRALGLRIEPRYRHRRSLARPARARLGDGAAPAPSSLWVQAQSWARYGARCAASYPRAFVAAIPEIAAIAQS
jgi:cytochrome P450